MGNNKGSVTLIEFDRVYSKMSKLLMGSNGRMWLQTIESFLQGEKSAIKKEKAEHKQHKEPKIEKIYNSGKTTILKFGGISSKKLKFYCRNKLDKPLINDVVFVMKQIYPSETEIEVELIFDSVENLGFTSPPTINEVRGKIIEIGFNLLTPEQVFSLFYKDEIESLLVPAMNPISLPDNTKISLKLDTKFIGTLQIKSQIPINTIIVFSR